MGSDELFTRTARQGLQMHSDQSVYRVTEYEFHDAGFTLADVRRLALHMAWSAKDGRLKDEALAPFADLLKEKNDG